MFLKSRQSVFRVEAGLGHGSGFLILHNGLRLVLTNDHVVGADDDPTVYLDTLTRVPARVVARDREGDLALLRIPDGRCTQCAPLVLAQPDDQLSIGETVVALGFPLNQEQTLTTGIVSGIREGAIISDVNINPGNSGGPLISLREKVVGVNTFGDVTNQGGPGISGAVAVSRVHALLARIEASTADMSTPADRDLPVMPRKAYPVALLHEYADLASESVNNRVVRRNAGKFDIAINTPVTNYLAEKAIEQETGKDRKRREAKAGLDMESRYSNLGNLRDWHQYAGDVLAPVVATSIVPKLSETFWSALGRGLEAYSYGTAISAAKMKFSGDVRGARLYRNGREVEPIRGGHAPQAILYEDRWVELKDVADRGYYVWPPEAFAPDEDGTPARVLLVVQDLKNPTYLSSTEWQGAESAAIWNSFLPFFSDVGSPMAQLRADPTRPSRKLTLDCVAATGDCVVRP